MYLPHAVRVLSVAIYGPWAFLALFPGTLIAFHIDSELLSTSPAQDREIWVALVGAGCAVVGYYAVNIFHRGAIPFREALRDWKPVFRIGVVASLVNSIGLAVVFREHFDPSLYPQLLMKYFVGDIFGLVVGSLLLFGFFRLIRSLRG